MTALIDRVGDEVDGIDFYAGVGGSTKGLETAGVSVRVAANHKPIAVESHGANFPWIDHVRADLSDTSARDYVDPESFPPVRVVWASPSCRDHSQANAKKLYSYGPVGFDADAQGLLFDPAEGGVIDAYANSERSRLTMVCPLRYAAKHHPEIAMIENVAEACFPGETVVLTKRGLVPIRTVRVGDEVMTHQARWKPVIAVRELRRPVVAIKGYCNSIIRSTADHRFYAREVAPLITQGGKAGRHEARLLEPTWVGARQLPPDRDAESTYRRQYSGFAWATPTVFAPYWIRPPRSIGMDCDESFWYMVGRWLGDGWLKVGTRGKQSSVRICASIPESNELEARLDETGLCWTRVHHAASVDVFETRNTKLVRWLRSNFGERAHSKRLPAWAFSLPVEHAHALLDGYVAADGCVGSGGRISTTSVSRALAVGVRMLVESLGRPASITTREGRCTPSFAATSRRLFITGSRRYDVSWSWSATDISKATDSELHRWGRVRSVDELAGEELVYDLTVADDESFIADGQVVHNCSWGPNRDGSTFRWWLGEWAKIGYEHEILFLNSMFFPPCPQSRDRMYIVFWRKGNPRPDLDYRPRALCSSDACGGAMVDAVQTWKPRTAAWPLARWGKYRSQYIYTCPACSAEVWPVTWPAYDAIDWSDLGPTLGERADLGMRPLKAATMERIRRAVAKYQHGPAVVIPAKAHWGVDRPVPLPLRTQTSEQDKALAVCGAILAAAGNTSERAGQTRARSLCSPLFTQTATREFGFAHLPATAVFRGGEPSHVAACAHGVGDVLQTVTAGGSHHGLVSQALFTKLNGGPSDTIWHPVSDPLNTITGRDTHGLVVLPWLEEWRRDPAGLPDSVERVLAAARGRLVSCETSEALSDAELADVRFRMLSPMPELRRGMAFPDDYIVLGSQEQQTDQLGNAVTPPVAAWITERAVATLRGARAVA